jgi:Glycosyl transferase family 2
MDCTIIIFHFESVQFLRACIRQINKYKRTNIPCEIIIADQSVDAKIRTTVLNEFADLPHIHIIRLNRYGSGYSVDAIIRKMNIQSAYICTLDVDAIPIHPNWLYVPIKLLEDEGLAFVGVHAEIEHAYLDMGKFYCMAQHFRVGRTEDFKLLSLNGGFTKNDHKSKVTFLNNEWSGWCDDAVVAHWWEDKYTTHDKFAFGVSKYLGVAPLEGRYGRYTDDLIFHFGFSYNWKMVGDKEKAMGYEFLEWMRRIDNDGLSEKMLDEILGKLIPLEQPVQRTFWDGTHKVILRPLEEFNAKIEQLKNE